MSALASLKLSNARRELGQPSIVIRRNKLADKIGEQILLAQAQQSGSTYTKIRYKLVRGDDGGTETVSIQQRVRPWWWNNESGKLCLNVRYGARALELAKGKSTVEVGDAKALVDVLNTLKSAALAGELDTQIEAVSGAVRSGFKK